MNPKQLLLKEAQRGSTDQTCDPEKNTTETCATKEQSR